MSVIELHPDKECYTCKNWSDKIYEKDGHIRPELKFCPVMGARGQYCTAKSYCQYWERKC